MNGNESAYRGWVFKLIILNVIIYFVQSFALKQQVMYSVQGFNGTTSVMNFYLGLIPALVINEGYLWQIFTYMFLHSTASFLHLFFNMYALFIFGLPIESEWGSRRFLSYYLICGAGAGITILVINLIGMNIEYYVPTIGASGAVFGLLLAFGLLFPEAEILIFFVLPIKAKYLVILYGGMELYFELFGGGGGSISHLGHLGGLLSGIIYFIIIRRRDGQYKLKTIKSNFQKKISKAAPENKSLNIMNPSDKKNRLEILKKIRESGYNSLTDDEIQFIKYLDIMSDKIDHDILCSESDLDINDNYCNNCENFDICFLREAKKHFKN